MRNISAVALALSLVACNASADGPGQEPEPSHDFDWDDPGNPGQETGDQPGDDANQDGDPCEEAAQCDDSTDDQDPGNGGEATAHDQEAEPNNDPQHATFLGTPDASASAELAADDSDWYTVRIVGAAEYVIETYTGDALDEEATDTRLGLFGVLYPQTRLHFDDDNGEGQASRLTVTLEPGMYLIQIDGYNVATSGPYTISVRGPDGEAPEEQQGPEQDAQIGPAQVAETESNGTVAAADSMGTAPSSIDATLDARDVDYFIFALAAPGPITIETAPTHEGESVDTVIELFASDGVRPLGSDDDGSDLSLFSMLRVDLREAGIYYVRVNGFGESTHGPYSLSIR